MENINEVEANEIDIKPFKVKDKLNPEFFNDEGQLNSQIRMRLLDIADDFVKTLEIKWIKPSDIVLTGSIANYNWSKFSDVDIHVIYKFSDVYEKTEFVKDYFNSKKELWNNTHDELTIKDFPVELSVEDSDNPAQSTGVYSLEKNKWVKEPENMNDSELNKEYIKDFCAKQMTKLDELFEEMDGEKDRKKLETLSNKVEAIYTKLKNMRAEGLATKEKEMSTGNIIWKIIKHMGYIEKLWNYINKVYDRRNTIDEKRTLRISENQVNLINESAVDRFIDKMIFSRLPEQLKQYVNTPVNDLLAKRPDLVNAQSLGATEAELAQLGGYPLKDFIRLSISKMFDIGHGKGPKKYLKGIFRIVLDELNYLQHPDQNAIQNLKNDVMYIMQASENGSDPDAMKLDGNLNGLNAGQLHNLFKNKRKAFAQGLRDKVSSMFKGGRSDYKVVPILKHEDAVKFQPYTSWCITYDSSANYNQYVQGGRRFYIFLKNGFEKIPKQTGQNCPMDEYGLSMISILVDMEGNIDYITTRWNHDHDGEYHNPDAETVQAFQNVIGMNLYDVCKPYTREELHAMGITPFDEVPALLAQGVPLQKIFDTVGDFVNGFAWVELNGKCNWVRADNGKLFSEDWFDGAFGFVNGFAKVYLNDKGNWVRADGQLFSDQWFDWVDNFENGFARVRLNDKWNWVRADNGQLLCEDWFDWVGDFVNGFAWVELNGKCNWVRADNGKLFSEDWFDYVGDFRNGFAAFQLNDKWNWVRADNGQLLCEDWFDWVGDFVNGFARVELNGKCNWVRVDGQLLCDKWFDRVGNFKNGFSAVQLNGKYNFVRADNGQLLCEDWFDRIGEFRNGFAKVQLNGKWMWIDTQGKLYDYDPTQRMVSESIQLSEAAMPEFNLQTLDSLKSFKKRLDYCKQMLGPTFGSGSSRVIFEIDDDKVLKLAKNQKGVAQNEFEEETSRYGSMVVQVFESGNDYTWLVEENCIPAREKDFDQLLGIPFETYCDLIRFYYNRYCRNGNKVHLYTMSSDKADKLIDQLYEQDEYGFVQQIFNLMGDYQLPFGDLTRISTYGMVMRDGEPEMVVIDSGLSEEILNMYYR